MTPEPAEHDRFHGYVHALSQVTDDDECDLLTIVLSDPDRAMAHSAVIGHLDRQAASLGSGEAFADWSRRIAPVLEGHDLPKRRLGEWVLLKGIESGQPWNTSDLIESSNWLQNTLAEHTGAREALAVLAENGRTNRIQNTARTSLKRGHG